ncbi:MAG: prepilin-type N-terminal cleavage/methylation domain-containing protein [Candidatus Omnitrophica bacterium]|nr:prepilin-type N-terminal cleavage/methylation domain-containing protein [Candidatus Omnitrophota bacterium]
MKSIFLSSFSNGHTPRKGFTLLEVIIVVVILGVLASLALPKYNNMVIQGECRSVETNMIVIYQAVKLFRMRNPTNSYPGSANLAAINATLGLSIADDPLHNYFIPAGSPWDMSVIRVDGKYHCYLQFPIVGVYDQPNVYCQYYSGFGSGDVCPSIVG